MRLDRSRHGTGLSTMSEEAGPDVAGSSDSTPKRRRVQPVRMQWAKLGAQAIADHRLSEKDLRVLAALALFRNEPSGKCYPSHEDLAAATRLSPSTVKRTLVRLREFGHVDWRHYPKPGGGYGTQRLRAPRARRGHGAETADAPVAADRRIRQRGSCDRCGRYPELNVSVTYRLSRIERERDLPRYPRLNVRRDLPNNRKPSTESSNRPPRRREPKSVRAYDLEGIAMTEYSKPVEIVSPTSRESIEVRGRRYLVEGRLSVWRIDAEGHRGDLPGLGRTSRARLARGHVVVLV